MKVYFDQNIWQYFIENISAQELNKRCNAKDIKICLGLHNIYEFARCFVDKNNPALYEKGKTIFRWLFDFDANYIIKPTRELIFDDIVYAMTSGKILPWLYGKKQVIVKEEIFNLSLGKIDRARQFITQRDPKIVSGIRGYHSLIVAKNKGMKRPINYEEIRDNLFYRKQILKRSEYEKKANRVNMSSLYDSPQKYPFINTFINVQIYLNYLALNYENSPTRHSSDDFRHLVDASATDLFVCNDKKLMKNAAKICYTKPINLEVFNSLIN